MGRGGTDPCLDSCKPPKWDRNPRGCKRGKPAENKRASPILLALGWLAPRMYLARTWLSPPNPLPFTWLLPGSYRPCTTHVPGFGRLCPSFLFSAFYFQLCLGGGFRVA